MIRAHGQRKDFGVEYSSEKRMPVGAGELVAWEFRERSAGGPHTLDFKLEFVEVGAEPEVSDRTRVTCPAHAALPSFMPISIPIVPSCPPPAPTYNHIS